jgi:ABC-type lipoprotein release transport system permease subunit
VQAVSGQESHSWQDNNAVFFSIFRLQNTITSLLIAFIVVIAGFGITNGLITLILEKQRDIGILKALGATARRIVNIFLLEGVLMGTLGALIGVMLARLAIGSLDVLPVRGQSQLTTQTTFTMLRGPWIYFFPALVAILVSLLASLLPVRRAAKYDPVEIIRSAK